MNFLMIGGRSQQRPGPGRSSAGYLAGNSGKSTDPKATRVYACFKDGSYYPGTILNKVKDTGYTVLFDDGDTSICAVSEMRQDDLRPNDKLRFTIGFLGELVNSSKLVAVSCTDGPGNGKVNVMLEGSKLDYTVCAEEIQTNWANRMLAEEDIVCLEEQED